MRVDLDALLKNYEHELYVTPITPKVVRSLAKELQSARAVVSAAKQLDDLLYSFLSGGESWADFDGYSIQLLKNSLQNYAEAVGEKYEQKIIANKYKKEQENKDIDNHNNLTEKETNHPDKDLEYHPYSDYTEYGEWE